MHDLNKEELREKRRIYARNYYQTVVKPSNIQKMKNRIINKAAYRINRRAVITRNMLYYKQVKERVKENKDGFGDRYREQQRQRNSEYYAKHRGSQTKYRIKMIEKDERIAQRDKIHDECSFIVEIS